MPRSILHVDINNCYASIECLYHPELRGKPMAVGGDVATRSGIILAKSNEAKAYGVKTGEALWQAKQKCPELIIVKPHYEHYLEFSRLTRNMYAQYTDQVEPFGLDEAWLDVSASRNLFGDSMTIAKALRKRVKRELGVTVSVGVSYNKVFAKLGSDYKKPDAVTEITEQNYQQKVWPLAVQELLYVGPATKRKLNARGVYTIGQLARMDKGLLESWLGKWGAQLWHYANGQEDSPVKRIGEKSVVKSIGNSTTTHRDMCSEQDVRIIFYTLAEDVAMQLRRQGFLCTVVQISVRDCDLARFERQAKLALPTCVSGELCSAAMNLFSQSYAWQKPLRSIGIRAAGLVPMTAGVQVTLFESEANRVRAEALERAIDDIRSRYGKQAIGRALVGLDTSLGQSSYLNAFKPFDRHSLEVEEFSEMGELEGF